MHVLTRCLMVGLHCNWKEATTLLFPDPVSISTNYYCLFLRFSQPHIFYSNGVGLGYNARRKKRMLISTSTIFEVYQAGRAAGY